MRTILSAVLNDYSDLRNAKGDIFFAGKLTLSGVSRMLMCLVVVAGVMGQMAWGQAQAGQGAVGGTVMDTTKAIIPGASVTLVNAGIGYSSTVVSDSHGEFSFSPVAVIGGFQLKVTAAGFSEVLVKNFSTSVGTIVTQNVTLAPGGSSTVVEVEGVSAEQVQTETSSLSQVVDNKVWESSPLSIRNQNAFVSLVAGAADDGGTGRGAAVNGARSGTGNFMVDGFDNNDQGQGGAGSTSGAGAVTTISPDAIQEFRVFTSTPNAEYGRAGGFATDTVLKSGTRQFHGSAFDYNRIQALAANNFFSTRSGLIDHLVRNQFGGSFGGRIYKDKTFFFATAEFQRQRQGSPISGIVATTQQFLDFVNTGAFQTFMEGTTQQNPTVTQDPNNPAQYYAQVGACPLNGYASTEDFSFTCPGTLARSATLGPVFKALIARSPGTFPLATDPSTFTNIAQGLFTSGAGYDAGGMAPGSAITTLFPVPVYGTTSVIGTTAFNQNRGSLKLDHKLTDRDQLSFTYIADLETSISNTGGGDSTPGPASDQIGGSQIFGATYTRTLTPTLVNVFKASFLRHVSNFESPGTQGIPSIFAADSLSTGFGATAGFPQLFTDNQFSYEDSISKTIGHHSTKFGFKYARTRNGSSFYNDVNGTVIPWSVEGIATDGTSDTDLDNSAIGFGVGGLYEATASIDLTTLQAPDPYRGFRANEFSTYAQDDWKVTPNLTINYGIRWEYFGPPHNFKKGLDSNVYFGTFGTPTPTGNPFLPNIPLLGATQGATFIQKDSNIWNKDTNNFAPRFGFSLDALGNQKLVVRGGFGLGYDRLYNNVYENLRFNAPHFVDNQFGYGASNGTAISEEDRAAIYQVPFTANPVIAAGGAKPVPRHIDQRLVTAYYEQIHFGFESQLPHGYVLETNYVGTLGRKLVGLENINTYEGRSACPTATYTAKSTGQGALCYAAGYTKGFSSARPNAIFNNDNFRTNGFSSNYSGGQVSLRKGYSNGLQLLANYTYSKAMDQVSDVFTIKSGATGITAPYNPSYDYGPADFDTRHNFILTANYTTHSSSHKLLLSGWGLSPIVNLKSGTPVDIIDGNSSYSPNKDGVFGVQRAVYKGTGSIKSSIDHSVSPADGFIKAGTWGAYTCPLNVNNGLWCDPPVQRNSLYGPRLINVDLGASKKLFITERYSVTLQAAFFDVFNHTEFGNPVGNTNSGTFGKSTAATNREGQLSARFDF